MRCRCCYSYRRLRVFHDCGEATHLSEMEELDLAYFPLDWIHLRWLRPEYLRLAGVELSANPRKHPSGAYKIG